MAIGRTNCAAGAALNYKVVSGTTQPASPAANTIWVNTSTTITKVVFSKSPPDENPSNVPSGTLWIKTDSASSVELPILATNKCLAKLDLLRAVVYTGSSAIDVDASVWDGTNWKPFKEFSLNSFSYTGTSTQIDDGSGNWRIKLLTSGTLTCTDSGQIQAFLVGGGGGGGGSRGPGGGAGYTSTITANINAGTGYSIVIGSGGLGQTSVAGSDGGSTTAFGYTANGGKQGTAGGAGGSGGGQGGAYSGGTDGGNGQGVQGGVGQGTTTREFGETDGTLYSTGGSGGSGDYTWGALPIANTGNGGHASGYGIQGRNGATGIVIIRNKRD